MTRTWPWWVQVLAVHLLARAVSAAVLMAVAARQVENLWTPASPSYAEFTGLMWDADWYRVIAEQGYPGELPRADGRVLQNPWAFFPLFPVLAGGLVRLTGGPWHVVAPTLALVLGAAAMLLVHRTVALGLQQVPADLPPAVVRALPLATVAVLTTSAAAPVLQVGYTESLALLLLAGTLWCLLRRRYLDAVPLVLALGLTRAVALPVTAAVLAHGVARWRGRDGWAVGDRVRLAVLAVVAAASGLLWPTITGLVTGEPDAYTLTQGAWRGRGEVVPLVPWLDVARWLFGPWGVLVLVAVAALAVALVAGPAAARLGPELRGWTAGYLAYLVLVLEPGTSLVRFLLLAYPAAALVALLALRSRAPRVALGLVLAAGLAGQVVWVWQLWRLVPPSGWPP